MVADLMGVAVTLFFLVSVLVAAYGFVLQRQQHPSGTPMLVGALVCAFFSAGFAAGNLL